MIKALLANEYPVGSTRDESNGTAPPRVSSVVFARVLDRL